MIIDYCKNSKTYENLIPGFKEAFEFAMGLKDEPLGRYENGDIFVLVQEGTTTPLTEGFVEAHRKYLDVQIMLTGQEVVGYEDVSKLLEATPYKEEKDVTLYYGNGQPIMVTPSMFYIVYPQDGHKPCKYLKQPTSYKKIVLKIPYSEQLNKDRVY